MELLELPPEIQDLILRKLPKSRKGGNPWRITAQVCKTWFLLSRKINPSPRIYLRDLLQSLELLSWAEGEGLKPGFSYGAATLAAKRGDLEQVKKLHSLGFQLNRYTVNAAGVSGNLELLSWVYERARIEPWMFWELVQGSLEKGRLESLEWFRKRGLKRGDFSRALIHTSRRVSLEALTWCVNRGFVGYMGDLLSDLVSAGKLEHLKILRAADPEEFYMKKDLCEEAVKAGNLPMLAWLATPWFDGSLWRVSPLEKKRLLPLAEELGHQHIINWLKR